MAIRSFVLVITCLLFSCRALQGDWSAPVDITPAGENSDPPELAVAANGGAVAVFREFTGGSSIRGAVLAPCGNTWTPTTDLATSQSIDPHVAVDANGNAVAIWRMNPGPILQGATLAAGSTVWTPTTDLTSVGSPRELDLAENASGEAVAIWRDAVTGIVQASTLAAGSSVWVPATADLSPAFQLSVFPQVAIDPAGNAVAVWQNATTNTIQGSTLSAGSSTWVPTADLSIPVAFLASGPQVNVDADGNALAIWVAFDNNTGEQSIQAARLPFGSLIWVPIGDAVAPSLVPVGQAQLAMNLSGDAIAIWERFDISQSIESSFLPAGSNTWTPTDLAVFDSDSARVAIDPAGNAVAVWSNFADAVIITQAASLTAGSVNWGQFTDLTLIESFQPSVGKDDFGNDVAVWGIFDGLNTLGQASVNLVSNFLESTVVANPTSVPADGVTPSTITVTLRDCNDQPLVGHAVILTALNGSSVISSPSSLSNALGQVTFTVTDAVAEIVTYQAHDTTDGTTIEQTATVQFGVGPLPPSNFHGKILPDPCHRCLRLHLLTWCPSPDPTVVSYRIYENGQVIATTGKKVHAVIIPNRLPDVSYTYSLVAVNAAGEESTPVTITSPAHPQSPSCEDSSRCCCR